MSKLLQNDIFKDKIYVGNFDFLVYSATVNKSTRSSRINCVKKVDFTITLISFVVTKECEWVKFK